MQALLLNFSGVYEAEGFLPFLQQQAGKGLQLVDFSALEGTCCYCDSAARACIDRALPQDLPLLRFLDSGDYHYMSHLLALREKKAFHLLLLDHHPDNQESAFGGMLSCGSWVKAMQEENPLLQSTLTLGPEGCPAQIPAGWLEQRRGERLYLSLDKDIMDKAWARTDWSQGTHTLEEVTAILRQVLDSGLELAALDICGETAQSKGATPEDLRINLETNQALWQWITNHIYS